MKQLEALAAETFDKEAGLFVPRYVRVPAGGTGGVVLRACRTACRD